ncbi:MAG: acetyl-CoA acetyltransferase [Lautropia sp.]
MQPACIVGIAETRYARRGGIQDRSEFQLACQAAAAAAADAGLRTSDIDGFSVFVESTMYAAHLQRALGMRQLNHSSSVWGGRGGGACGALAHAVQAVQSGAARHVLVFRSLCQGNGRRRYGQVDLNRVNAGFDAPFGLLSMPQMCGLIVERYRHEHGLDEETLATVALVCRDNAQRNPRAVMHGVPLTLQGYLAARRVAGPFRLNDCCLETDGAAALIVTTQERARDLQARPVQVLAALQGTEAAWGDGETGHNAPDAIYATANQRRLAERLFARAGIAHADVDVMQIYDAFTGMVPLTLEDFGFCGRGEAGAFLREAGIHWNGGRLPVNTHGGSLSEAYVHGLNHVLEGVRQLRGTSTSQVEDARVCVVTSASMISPTSAAVLAAA